MKNARPWHLWCIGAGAALAVASPAATFNVPPPPSLTITSAPGTMRITYRGATNVPFLIQGSSNLLGWSTVASNLATNASITFVDSSSSPLRFYKAASLKAPFVYQGTFSGAEQGSFVLLARTNDTAAFLAINTTTGHKRGEYAALTVGSNNMNCAPFIVGVSGCLQLTSSNTISGRFTNAAQQTGTLLGTQRASAGIFSGAAGMYTGNIPDPHVGAAKLLLCPDGSFAFFRNDSYAGRNDGAVSVLPLNGPVDAYLSGSPIMHLAGTFSRTSRVFNLTIHETDGLISTFTMTLSEAVF